MNAGDLKNTSLGKSGVPGLSNGGARLRFRIGMAVILAAAQIALVRPALAIERGGDISEIGIEEQLGTVYRDANGNVVADGLQLCQDNGWTVASYSDGGGVCDWGVFFVDNRSLSYNWGAKTLFEWPSHNAMPAFSALVP